MISTVKRAIHVCLDNILWLVWLFIIPFILFAPSTIWYELRSVVVTDDYTAEGQRIVLIDRSINRSFYGEWRVEEQKRIGDHFTTVQLCEADNYYLADKGLPEIVTLDWWKGENCRPANPQFAPGEYRICTWVTIMPQIFPPRTVNTCSPIFKR